MQYAADSADRKSITGGVICLDGMIVGLMSRKAIDRGSSHGGGRVRGRLTDVK